MCEYSRPYLEIVLVAPRVREFGVLPALPDREQSEVVALGLGVRLHVVEKYV